MSMKINEIIVDPIIIIMHYTVDRWCNTHTSDYNNLIAHVN